MQKRSADDSTRALKTAFFLKTLHNFPKELSFASAEIPSGPPSDSHVRNESSPRLKWSRRRPFFRPLRGDVFPDFSEIAEDRKWIRQKDKERVEGKGRA